MSFSLNKQQLNQQMSILFQDAEVNCKICKTDFNDARNKITLLKRGSELC